MNSQEQTQGPAFAVSASYNPWDEEGKKRRQSVQVLLHKTVLRAGSP